MGGRHVERNDPDLIPAAVEEILRAMDNGGDSLRRYARADLEIAGTPVGRGDLVLFDTGAANHDAAVFPSPDHFDITRPPITNLAFGRGATTARAPPWPAWNCERSSPGSSAASRACGWPYRSKT